MTDEWQRPVGVTPVRDKPGCRAQRAGRRVLEFSFCGALMGGVATVLQQPALAARSTGGRCVATGQSQAWAHGRPLGWSPGGRLSL